MCLVLFIKNNGDLYTGEVIAIHYLEKMARRVFLENAQIFWVLLLLFLLSGNTRISEMN